MEEKNENEDNIKEIEEDIKIILKEPDKFDSKRNLSLSNQLNNIENIKIFLDCLNKKRVSNVLNENSFNTLGPLFNQMVGTLIKEHKMKLYDYLLTISATYYYKNSSDEKIFLCEFIEDFDEYKNIDFWIDYLMTLIVKQSEDTGNKIDLTSEQGLLTVVLPCLFSATENMNILKCEQDFIKKFLDKIVKEKFKISQKYIDDILMNISSSKNKEKEALNLRIRELEAKIRGLKDHLFERKKYYYHLEEVFIKELYSIINPKNKNIISDINNILTKKKSNNLIESDLNIRLKNIDYKNKELNDMIKCRNEELSKLKEEIDGVIKEVKELEKKKYSNTDLKGSLQFDIVSSIDFIE